MVIKRKLRLSLLLTLFAVSIMIADEAFAWYNTAWNYRQMIIINSSKVPGDLTNFPVFIQTTDPDLRVSPAGNVGKANGGDILFTLADEMTKLDHEIESYNSATGELVAWVEVPFVLSTADTVLFMYYGNAGAANQWNINGTWDEGGASNYLMVQHLQEDAGGHFDSTSNNNGAPSGVTQGVAGKIDGADGFDGIDDYIGITENANPNLDLTFEKTDPFSLSAWVKRNSTGSARVIIGRETLVSDRGWSFRFTASDVLSFALIEGCCPTNWFMIIYSNAVFTSTSDWYHVVATYDGSNNVSGLRLYVDGVNEPVTQLGSSIDWSLVEPAIVNIGALDNGAVAPFDGIIDEVRVSNIVRTPDWIETSYNNQSDPSSFLSFGVPVSGVPVPTMTGWGMVVFVMLAGLGAIYYLRRQRTV